VNGSPPVSPRGIDQPAYQMPAADGSAAAEHTVEPLSSLDFLCQVAEEVALANDDSVEVIAALTRSYLNASAAGVSAVDRTRRTLRIAALVPRARSNDSYVWQSLPLDRRFPGGAAVLNAATYALCTRAEILETFPSVTEYPVGDKARALYCAPLIRRAEIVGTVFAAWQVERRLSDEQRATMRVLSTLAANVFEEST
jgi:GAF domain-containing protein